ncbi:MAG TPA: hypothetical protein VE596_17190 [Gaiellaceae bacterium]|nr:hypothetical protein [Gaiellaceae bacterium]
MARDDYRIRVDLEEEHAHGLLSRLGLGSKADELAEELEGRRLVVSHDEGELFVYASSPQEAERARAIVESELAEEGLDATVGPVEHWLHDEERWDDEPPEPTPDEELLEEGIAPWEVRVECASRAKAEDLADQLEAEGYGVVRRFRYVVVGTDTRDDAEALAKRLHGEVEPSSAYVWENVPQNPFVVFGGLGGAGTPL